MRSIFENRVKAADYIQLLLNLIPTSNPNSNKIHEYYQSEMHGADDLKKNIKLLAEEAVAPNAENLRNGTYPLIQISCKIFWNNQICFRSENPRLY